MRNVTLMLPTIAAAGLGGAAVPASGQGIPVRFDTWTGFDSGTYDTARFPWAAAVADLDGDGDDDVAAANWPQFISPRLSVLKNLGDGTFAPPDHYAIAKPALDIVAADLDGDGLLDLAATNTGVNYEGNTVSVLRNLGGGTFAPHQQYTVGAGSFVGALGLAARDFDADGDADIAVACFGFFGQGSTVALLRNNGNGTFAAPLSFPAGGGPYKLAAADFNADGLPDVAVANDEQRMNVLLNNGAGGFAAAVQYAALTSINTDVYQSIAAADVDLDGDVDVLYSSSTTSMPGGGAAAVALYRNQGAGTFSPAQGIPQGSFISMAAADMTGDGWPDILGAHTGGGWALVPGTGAGGFGAAILYTSGQSPVEVRTSDVDLDGDLDAVIANRDSLEVCIHRNPGDGDFSPPPAYPAPMLSDLDHADIDGDGDLDAGLAFRPLVGTDGGVAILRNLGDGSFAAPVNYPSPQQAAEMRFADLSADGAPDLLWADDFPPYNFKTRLNPGGGAFAALASWTMGTCGTCELEAADFDCDGDPDVAAVECLGCPSIPTSARRIFVMENAGSASVPSFQLHHVIVTDPGPAGLDVADYNGDGRLDLAVSSQPVNVLLGNGDLTFTIVPVAAVPCRDLASADLDGDGDLDLAVAIAEGGSFHPGVAVLKGNGNGTFQAPQVYGGSYSPDLGQITEIAAADADGDGDVDLVTANYASNDASYYENLGDGSFKPHVRYGLGLGPTDIAVADFTGDGVADLAAPTHTVPPLTGHLTIAAGLPGNASIPGDIDGDGNVGILDFLALLAAWGPCPAPPAPCPADIDGDGSVAITDMLLLLGNWGKG
jgi:hypothetical protein